MSDQTQTQSEVLGVSQTGAPMDTASGARMDTQGAVPTDFTGRISGMRQKGRDLLSRGMDAVRDEPWRAVLIGMFFGWLLGRRTRRGMHMVRVDYLEPGYHRAQGAMTIGTLVMRSMLRMFGRSMALRGREVMFNVRCYAKPLTKATRRVGKRAQRKLHIGHTSSFWR